MSGAKQMKKKSKKQSGASTTSCYILFNQLTIQSLVVASSSCLGEPKRVRAEKRTLAEFHAPIRDYRTYFGCREPCMVMLSETNAWKKIGGKCCWQASSVHFSEHGATSIHISSNSLLRVFQSQPPLPLQCLFFFLFFQPFSSFFVPSSFSSSSSCRFGASHRIANYTDSAIVDSQSHSGLFVWLANCSCGTTNTKR